MVIQRCSLRGRLTSKMFRNILSLLAGRFRTLSRHAKESPACSEPPRLLRLARAWQACCCSRPNVVPLEAAVLEVVAQDAREEASMTNDCDRRLGA